jgi:hypothetical protein
MIMNLIDRMIMNLMDRMIMNLHVFVLTPQGAL